MTIIIDSSHSLPPSTGDNETALALQVNETVLLEAGSSVTTSGAGSTAISGVNSTLMLNGIVRSDQDVAIATSGRINVSATGFVVGAAEALHLGGFVNDAPGTNLITNAGVISSKGVAVLIDSPMGTQTAITNSGTIAGADAGIWFYANDSFADNLTIINSGLIKGNSFAINGLTHGSNTVVNSGQIEGSVYLATGSWESARGPVTNIYDGRGGSITGTVFFGAGNDIAYGGDGAETFDMGINANFVDGGSGDDTLNVSGTVDLRLTGKQQINFTTSNIILNIENLAGKHQADRLTGNNAENELSGGGGGDVLDGRNGDDLLTGGEGNDTLFGGEGTDAAIFTGKFSDYVIEKRVDGTYVVSDGRSGTSDNQDVLTDIEFAQFSDRTIALSHQNSAPTSISLDNNTIDLKAKPGSEIGHLSGVDPDGDPLGYFLVSNPGDHFRILGGRLLVNHAFTSGDTNFDVVVRASDPQGASLDRHFTIVVTTDPVTHAMAIDTTNSQYSDSQSIKGGRKADVLVGGAGSDWLDGGLGKDKLTGNGGTDVFAFSTRLDKSNVDVIVDFDASTDAFQLSRSIFTKLHKGSLSKDEFRVGAKALDAKDHILFNAKTGVLSYDADGSGNAYEAVAFARLKAKSSVSADDFLIV